MTMTQAEPRGGVLDSVQLHHVTSIDELWAFLRWMGERHDGPLCADTESASLAWHRAKHRMTQIGDKRHGWAFPPAWMGPAHETLGKWAAAGGRIGFFNSPYDWLVLDRHAGLQLPWSQIDDAQLVSHLADSAPIGLHAAKAIALKARAAHDIDPTAMAWQKAMDEAMSAQKWTHATVPDDFPPYWQYGAGDPVLTSWLLDKHLPMVRRDYSAAYGLEIAYARICTGMMRAGMALDIPYIEEWTGKLSAYAEAAMAWLSAGWNIGSVDANAQVGAALELAGVDVEHTRTGKIAVNKEAMDRYQLDYPHLAELISTIRNAKKAQQVVSRHLAKFLAMADDGVIYCAIHSIGAQQTSRSSITDPALQTFDRDFPIIRGSFVPRPGHVFVSWDASQIEARLAAHFSGDPRMIEDFAYCDRTGKHFFLLNAEAIYREAITKSDPRYTTTKNTFYGMTYGSGPETAAITAGVPLAMIEPIYEGFKRRYRVLNNDSFRLVESQKRPGHRPRVHTLWGRRLYADRAYALIDYRIQGTAAEILKDGAVRMDAAGLGHMLRLPIHDELLAEVPIGQAEEVLRAGIEILTDREHFRVPILWEGQIMPERWVK